MTASQLQGSTKRSEIKKGLAVGAQAFLANDRMDQTCKRSYGSDRTGIGLVVVMGDDLLLYPAPERSIFVFLDHGLVVAVAVSLWMTVVSSAFTAAALSRYSSRGQSVPTCSLVIRVSCPRGRWQ